VEHTKLILVRQARNIREIICKVSGTDTIFGTKCQERYNIKMAADNGL
jgi:hypothetical protein